MRTIRRLAILPLALFALAAAAPFAAAVPAPPPKLTSVHHVASHFTGPTVTDIGVVRVATAVTARWEALSAARTDFTVCLQHRTVADTLQVDFANPSNDCSSASARSSYRPTCEPTQSDADAFAATNEQLRFTICAPGKAFMLLRNSTRVPATVPLRRGA